MHQDVTTSVLKTVPSACESFMNFYSLTNKMGLGFCLTFSFALLWPWPISCRLSSYNLCSVWSLSLCCRVQSSLSSCSSCCSSCCRLCSTSLRICRAMCFCCSRTWTQKQRTSSKTCILNEVDKLNQASRGSSNPTSTFDQVSQVL